MDFNFMPLLLYTYCVWGVVLCLHSAKNPDDTELEDTLLSVVSNVYCVLCVFKWMDTETQWMLV